VNPNANIFFLLNCELIFLSGSAMGVLVLGFNASQASTLAATSLKSQRKSFSRLANYFDLSTTKAVLKKIGRVEASLSNSLARLVQKF
jgi:hypothetical protein